MHLHIVSFNVPWPADYGGVIDVFARIKALHEAGVKIHLHCYTYGREPANQLLPLCQEVHYYRRATGWLSQLQPRPYIVASRQSQRLLERLRHDDYPILLEGLHNGYLLEKIADGKRRIFVRAHNVEHDYYLSLAQSAGKGWERCFYAIEALKLRRYEQVLKKATAVLAISSADADHFRQMGCRQVVVLPPNHDHSKVTSLPGQGKFILYHGNLSVPENIRAVTLLSEAVMQHCDIPFIVAGHAPDATLRHILSPLNHVQLIADPDDETMHRLIRDAHINLLVTEQATGVKLKLVNALYEGRHCIVNAKMVAGTNLAPLCHLADTPQQLLHTTLHLMETPFTQHDVDTRTQALSTNTTTPLLTLLLNQ